jgi:hypothetical protein
MDPALLCSPAVLLLRETSQTVKEGYASCFMLQPAIPIDTGFTLYYITTTMHVKHSTDFGFESNSSLQHRKYETVCIHRLATLQGNF